MYTPSEHKTEHHGHDRKVYLSPRSQTVLQPFLRTELASHLFSPKDAERDRAAAASTHRRPGQSVVPRKTARRLLDRYDVASYRRAIARGSELAGVPCWSPNRLRHNAATRLRRECGIDVAHTILGHRLGSTVTEIYPEANVLSVRSSRESGNGAPDRSRNVQRKCSARHGSALNDKPGVAQLLANTGLCKSG